MNSSLVSKLLVFGLSAALSPVALMAQDNINASIPFNFSVGPKTFDAGDYRIHRLNDNVLLIQSVETGAGVMTMVLPGDASKTPGEYKLVFNRYRGDHYFLSQVEAGFQGWKVRPCAAEKEMSARAPSPKPVIVAALHSK